MGKISVHGQMRWLQFCSNCTEVLEIVWLLTPLDLQVINNQTIFLGAQTSSRLSRTSSTYERPKNAPRYARAFLLQIGSVRAARSFYAGELIKAAGQWFYVYVKYYWQTEK